MIEENFHQTKLHASDGSKIALKSNIYTRMLPQNQGQMKQSHACEDPWKEKFPEGSQHFLGILYTFPSENLHRDAGV